MQKKFLVIEIIIIVIIVISTIYIITTNKSSSANDNNLTTIKEKNNYKDAILIGYKKQKIDINLPIETEISKNPEGQLPEITNKSKQLLNSFNKDISKAKDVRKIYDKTLNREVTRVTSEDAEVDFDSNGNIVRYKNFDDFSTVDKDKRDYNENDDLPKIDYKIKKSSDLSDTISIIESENYLTGYKLIECSNNIESAWILTWVRDYGNGLINPYDCINAMIDAKDGSVMLFGRNKMEPNATVPILTQDEAIKLAEPIISKYDNINIDVKLTFFRPNFYWEEGGPYESADFVRLSWEVSIKNCVSVQIDAETGEILGGGSTQSVSVK